MNTKRKVSKAEQEDLMVAIWFWTVQLGRFDANEEHPFALKRLGRPFLSEASDAVGWRASVHRKLSDSFSRNKDTGSNLRNR